VQVVAFSYSTGQLALSPEQAKAWEELEAHEQIIEDYLDEEGGEGGEILDAISSFDSYAKQPYFKCDLDVETITQTVTLLLTLNNDLDPSELLAGEEESTSLSAVVAVLIGIAGNLFETEGRAWFFLH
jgi:hypothetical protein